MINEILIDTGKKHIELLSDNRQHYWIGLLCENWGFIEGKWELSGRELISLHVREKWIN